MHYEIIWTAEKKDMAKPAWFGGETSSKSNPQHSTSTAPIRRRNPNKRDDTMVRRQLAALPTFTPWFIYIITFLQVCFKFLLKFASILVHNSRNSHHTSIIDIFTAKPSHANFRKAVIFIGMMAHAKTKKEIATFGLQTSIINCTLEPPCPIGFNGFDNYVIAAKSLSMPLKH